MELRKLMRMLPAATVLLAGTGLVVRQVLADEPRTPATEKAPRASRLDLTPESLPKLRALIRPQDNEWRHLRVHWLTDPVAALKKAAAEDKPIVYLYLGGAGYNAPLGVC